VHRGNEKTAREVVRPLLPLLSFSVRHFVVVESDAPSLRWFRLLLRPITVIQLGRERRQQLQAFFKRLGSS
jgi:hypothetical protein